jgi:predicted  nucleic acid-binding Zn-ribbon protein
MEQMNKKAQAARMTVSQHIEGEKLQSSIDDLNRQGVALKVDLDDLRSQMIDLDKRKSYLETTIKQLP